MLLFDQNNCYEFLLVISPIKSIHFVQQDIAVPNELFNIRILLSLVIQEQSLISCAKDFSKIAFQARNTFLHTSSTLREFSFLLAEELH